MLEDSVKQAYNKSKIMKTILITGSTDGLGYATAKMLLKAGHRVYLHGRSADKIARAQQQFREDTGTREAGSFVTDLSDLKQVRQLASDIRSKITHLDALINNAGVFNLDEPLTADGLDARFVVNMIAPYFLTCELRSILDSTSRVVNLSSAAQAPVEMRALKGELKLPSNLAYAQSKLGVTMWTNALAAEAEQSANAPLYVSVNPKSFLGTSMVRKAYGMAGVNVNIGADIICRAALSEEFAHANGKYFDNDSQRFAAPHPDGNNPQKCKALVAAMNQLIKQYA